MGTCNLLKDIVQAVPPFMYCGMDCFSSFLIKEGRKIVKSYGAIFTCLAFRAVHLEVLKDIITEAFINCLHGSALRTIGTGCRNLWWWCLEINKSSYYSLQCSAGKCELFSIHGSCTSIYSFSFLFECKITNVIGGAARYFVFA